MSFVHRITSCFRICYLSGLNQRYTKHIVRCGLVEAPKRIGISKRQPEILDSLYTIINIYLIIKNDTKPIHIEKETWKGGIWIGLAS